MIDRGEKVNLELVWSVPCGFPRKVVVVVPAKIFHNPLDGQWSGHQNHHHVVLPGEVSSLIHLIPNF